MSRLFLLACALVLAPAAFTQEKPETKKEEPKDGNELPIKPARTVEFTTDEGTWMSLDLSPDGSTIVFELLGDLYTMPAGGGTATRIVGGMHFDSQPKFSPDGKKIAFVSDRSGGENVWLVDANGANPKALTKGRRSGYASPNWSTDGNYIYASKSEGGLSVFRLVMLDVRGGSGLPLGPRLSDAGRRGTNRMGVISSPDGRFLYYAERQGLWSYDSRFPLWQIRRFDRQTGDETTVTNSQGSALRPMISPDGNTLVYATRFRTGTALRARDLRTGVERWVAYPIDRDDQEAVATRDTVAGYDFTLDGKALIMPLHGKIQRVDLATGQATVIPFSAKVQSEVGKSVHHKYRVDDSPTVKARIIRDTTLSPDGKRLLFTAFNRLYVMDYPGGTPRRLTNENEGEFQPSWSPDGRWVTYVTWGPMGGHVQKVEANGGRPQKLTSFPAYYTSPVFTPDGGRIVFMKGTTDDGLKMSLRHHTYCFGIRNADHEHDHELGGIYPSTPLDLYVMPSSGGPGTFIVSSGAYSSVQFGKDPNRMFLVGSGGLTLMRTDGLDKRELLKITGGMMLPGQTRPTDASDIRISPDGQTAAVSVQNKLYTVTLPMLGGVPVDISVSAGGGAVPMKRIALEGGDFLGWTPDGKSVTWALGDKFYSMPLEAEKPTATTVTVELPRATPQGTVVLRGARIITMKGDQVIGSGDVVVTNNKITYVGPKAPNLPTGAKIIDCRGKTIAPGFIDVHSHWFGPGNPKLAQGWGYLANLAYGVTTNRDPQSGSSDIYDYSDMIETGQAIGPRVYTTGPGVFADSGLEDLEATKAYIKRYAEAYKTMTLKQYIAGDRMARQHVLMACDEYKITPTTEGALDFKLNLTQMIDGFSGHEHSLPIQPIYNDVVQLVKQTNTFYTPTLLVNYGAPTGENYWFTRTDVAKDAKLRRFVPDELLDTMVRRRPNWVLDEEYGFKGIAQGLTKVVRAGGRVCLGSHGQLQGLGAHWELWSIASGGMTAHEALKCATIFGAEAIGLDQDLGSIEPGKFADLIVFDKNPLENIQNTVAIRYVMKNGELFEGETMDQVWPVRKKLGPIYYQNYGPATTIRTGN